VDKVIIEGRYGNITNRHDVDQVFFDAVLASIKSYSKGDAEYSVTDLNQAPREYWLKRRHWKEVVVDVSDLFAMWRGDGLHMSMEQAATGEVLTEERLFAEVVGGIKISGAFDRYVNEGIEDLKSTSVWSFVHKAKPEWEKQLNMYADLMRDAGFPVNSLKVLAALYDWNRNEARRNADYPQSPFHSVEIPLWPIAQAKMYISETATLLNSFKDVDDHKLPLCTDEDRWASETTYAVMKGNNVRATKVCASEEDALEFIGSHKDGAKMKVEERKGEDKKCMNYCDSAPFCDYWRENYA
jgi:hypothetical protein